MSEDLNVRIGNLEALVDQLVAENAALSALVAECKAQPTSAQVTTNRKFGDWEGFSCVQVIRWMGFHQWTPKQIAHALPKLGFVGVSQYTITTQKQVGRKGEKVPTLTSAQADTINALKVQFATQIVPVQ